ncbi:Nonribosomal Peptide Synthase (NRPS) [Taiwanofungus camphoratus]|nr:Nonribosomal Peptide Synthase (NRPS) [Antrodia cinnamomea]
MSAAATAGAFHSNSLDKFASGPEAVKGQSDLARVISFSGVLDLPQALSNFHIDTARGIHTDFEDIAKAHPEWIAVELGEGEEIVTYGELDHIAGHVASQLVQGGIRDEELVPVIASRTPRAIAGIIGVLKAGGAYVPCDAGEWTQDRIDIVLATIKPRNIVVTDRSFVPLVAAYTSLNIIVMDKHVYSGGKASSTHKFKLSDSVTPSSNGLAYVIMTSGTSGTPKGVMVDHKNLIQYVRRSEPDRPGNLGVKPGDRAFLVFSIAFDACSGVIWSTLCNGATLCLADKTNIAAVAKRVTHFPCTPSLLSSLSPNEYPQIRGVFAGGEALPLSLVQSWARDGRRIFNCYGPTETTCAATVTEVRADSRQVTIGGPLVGYAVLVVDQDLKPVGVGVSGELVIGGRGVARGYYGNEKLTSEKFVELEWVEKTLGIKSSGKWYRTGDLARWTHDGMLEYLGRSDWRVKNRGFLIDLEGDVESAMVADTAVSDAKAFMIRGRLLGAVTPADTDTRALRERLLVHTPAYMVCNKIFAFDKFPRTSNDKVDRRRLQTLVESLVEQDSASYGPAAHTEPQHVVAEGFRVLFNMNAQIGIHASFIELGGDSITAIRLVSFVRAAGFAISFQDVLRLNTIEAIAAVAVPLASLQGEPTIGDDAMEDYTQLMREILGDQAETIAEDIAPLTPSQRGMFITTASKPTVYSIQTHVTLQDARGSFDPARFTNAWRRAIRRHAIFRSSFHLEHGQHGVQIVHRDVPDLPSCLYIFENDADLNTALRKYLADDLSKGFAVDDFTLPGKLMRLALFTVRASQKAYFVWTVHHGLIDGLSASILEDELIHDYNDQVPLNAPCIPARSFASVAREITSQQSKQEQVVAEFWREHLQGMESAAPLNLPRLATSALAAHEVLFESTLSLDLVAEFARQSSVTISTIFLAAAAVVLCRYTNKLDANLGVVLTGRSSLLNAEQVVGPIVNTLPVHLSIEDEHLSVKDLLRATSAQVMSATAWEWSSLRSAMSALGIQADKDLFDFAFSFSDDFASEMTPPSNVPALQMCDAVTTEQTEFPFSVTFERTAKQNVAVRIRQQPQTIHEAFAKGMGRHFCNVVAGFMSASSVKDIQLTDAAERQHLIHGLNSHHLEPYRQTITVRDRLVHSMKTHRSLPAIAQGNDSITYAELDRQSSAVAYYLATHHGVTVGSTVGILAMHSIEWLIGMCGIVKAGAAYLPIDASYPPERQIWVLEQGDNVGVILVPRTPNHDSFKVKILRIANMVEYNPPPVPLREPKPQDVVAYVYTSGSTGVPKGVPLTQGGLDTALQPEYSHLWAAPGRRTALMMALGFDGSFMSTFGSLLYGGTVVLQDPSDPLEHLKHVHCVMCTPSMLASLDETEYKNLDSLALGGEALPQGLADAWSSGRNLVNMYGPSECHILATCKYLSPGEPVSLGRPLPKTRIYCVDPDTNFPVPVGLPGEIWIGGSSPTIGYVGRPDATKDKFMSDPFGYPGERIYRTGDIGRWNLKGDLEYVGRVDDLIKVKGGFRLTLIGVENALNREASNYLRTPLASATVVLVKDSLVAYVTPGNIDTSALRERLSETEPHFAVPKWIIALDTLPMTPNQKIDRKALVALPLPEREEQYFEPLKTPTEHNLATIWKDLLDVKENISATAHFVRLGGTSLNQIRLVSRLQRSHKVKVPLTLVINNPVLRNLATAVDGLVTTAAPLVENITFNGDTRSLSHSERGMWLAYQLAPIKTPFTVSALYAINGTVDTKHLKQAFDIVLARHAIFRARYHTDSRGIPARDISGDSPRAQVISRNDFDASLDQEMNYVFDISAEHLVRVRLASDKGITSVLFTANHIVVDHWTVDIVMKEVSSVYASLLRGENAALAALGLDYPQWAASSQRAEHKHLKFWADYLRDIPDCITLPTSYPRPAIKSYAGRSRFFKIPEQLRQDVERAAAAHGVTLHQFFSAALLLVLSVFTGQDDIVIGASHANRRSAEEYELCGLFLDRIPFRMQLTSENQQSTESLLQSVVASQQAASMHFTVPFDEIARHVHIRRDLGRHPIFQVMLSVENETETIPKLTVAGALVENVQVAPSGSNFDLLIGYQLLPNAQGMRLRFEASDIYDDTLVNAMEASMRTALAMLADYQSTPTKIFAALQSHVVRAPTREEKVGLISDAMLAVIGGLSKRERAIPDDTTFFELGGTSALAPVLVKELESRGARVSLIDLFTSPSIRDLVSRASFRLQ